MRRIRYSVAISLDGYIAGPNGETDWISTDPEFGFSAIMSEFDTVLVGRRTWQNMKATGNTLMPDMRTLVASRTLLQRNEPTVTIIPNPSPVLTALREKPGKDIWLFGGGTLFRSLAKAGLVDAVEVAVMPVLLGAGIPLLAGPAARVQLTLTSRTAFRSGIVWLKYDVADAAI